MRPARPLAALLVLVLLGACAGSPGPRAWASAVCTALVPWRTEIDTLTTRAQDQMSAAVTPSQARENLVRLFDGAEQASEKARAGVAKAGVPDVDDGKQIATGFTGALSSLRDAYGRAKGGIQALSVDNAEDFYSHVTTVVDQLNKDYQGSSLDTSKLNSPDLRKAFDEEPECR
jgi:hypothetical protein